MRVHRRAFKYYYCEVSGMKKVSSIFLRSDIYLQDVDNLIGWMDNPDVTMYLNEDHALRRNLTQLLRSVPAPLLAFRFNEFGKFFYRVPRQKPIYRICQTSGNRQRRL